MRKIKLYKQTEKFLKRLPRKQQIQIVRHVISLKENTQPTDAKKLVGYDRFYRVDSGEYRIVYWWDDAFVHVVLVGKRNDSEVYRKLKRSK